MFVLAVTVLASALMVDPQPDARMVPIVIAEIVVGPALIMVEWQHGIDQSEGC